MTRNDEAPEREPHRVKSARRRSVSDLRQRASRYAATVRAFWKDAQPHRDFVPLMRIRMAQSKLGWAACRSPIRPQIGLKSMGGPVRLRSHTTDISVYGEILISHG